MGICIEKAPEDGKTSGFYDLGPTEFTDRIFIGLYVKKWLSNPYSHLIYCNVAFILVVIDAGVLLLFESLKNVLKRGYYQEFAMTVNM